MIMRSLLFFLLVVSLAACEAPENNCAPVDIESDSQASTFDSLYAEKLGADEYGMHSYVMALLKEGPNRDQTEEEAKELQRAHLDNIIRLADEGVLVLAGPYLDDTELKGIYIFDVKTIEEAKALTESDPAIKAGRLIMELHPWYGSAGVMEVNEIHKRIAKMGI